MKYLVLRLAVGNFLDDWELLRGLWARRANQRLIILPDTFKRSSNFRIFLEALVSKPLSKHVVKVYWPGRGNCMLTEACCWGSVLLDRSQMLRLFWACLRQAQIEVGKDALKHILDIAVSSLWFTVQKVRTLKESRLIVRVYGTFNMREPHSW